MALTPKSSGANAKENVVSLLTRRDHHYVFPRTLLFLRWWEIIRKRYAPISLMGETNPIFFSDPKTTPKFLGALYIGGTRVYRLTGSGVSSVR
jgi:hypothetical protein